MTPATAYALYAIIALGAVGLYLMLPQPGRPRAFIGALVGLAALLALLILLGVRVLAPEPSSAFFYLFAGLAIAAAARVITHHRPVYSALYFVVVVVCIAALVVMLRAEFLAVALVIVYAGAIMVTYLFVIMLAQQPGTPVYDRHAREPLLAVIGGFLLMAAIAGRAADFPPPPSGLTVRSEEAAPLSPEAVGNTMAIGAALMTRYIVAIEISGVLLLVAMVGAVAMARKRVPVEGYRPPRGKPGEIGKRVEPF